MSRKRWLESLSTERSDAYKAIVALRDRLTRGDQLADRVDALLDRVTADRGDRVPARFSDWAHARLPVALREFFAAVPTEPKDEASLHRFRIRGKELRYVMELLAGAFPEEFRTTLYSAIEALQDRLGEINDLATAKRRLQNKLAEADHAPAWQRLLAHECAELDRARRTFWEWCTPERLSDLRSSFAAMLGDSVSIAPATPNAPAESRAKGRSSPNARARARSRTSQRSTTPMGPIFEAAP